MNIFNINDNAVLIIPANLHSSLPGMLDKLKGKGMGYYYKVYDLHIGTAVKVLDFKNGYYKVECPLLSEARPGWIKQIALEGEGSCALKADILCSNNHIKNYYLSVVDILVARQQAIADTLEISQTERIFKVVVREAAVKALGLVGKLIPIPGASTILETAANELIPQTASKTKLDHSERLKARKQSVVFTLYSKIMHLMNSDDEGRGTLSALDQCIQDTFESLTYSMYQRNEMHQDTRNEVIAYFNNKFSKIESEFQTEFDL